MKLNNISIALILSFMVSSCGYYSLKDSIPAHLKNVIVMPIVNETAEFDLAKKLHDELINSLVEENILTVSDFESADCKIDILIKNMSDNPDVILSNNTGYESVNQWKISIQIDLLWYDMIKNKNIIEKTFFESIVYSYDNDIGLDGIDNDYDGLIDEEDLDELLVGTPRDGAIKMCINKVSRRIISELTSTW